MLVPIITYSQTAFSTTDFSGVDSLARSIKYESDIFKLTNDLTGSYSKDLFKVRSIFIWITENIKYDYKFINKGKEIKTPDCEGVVDCSTRLKDWENDYVRKTLKSKKAICDGYARLLKRMCDIAGIKCDVISGYTKTHPYQIGNAGSVNHAWNAVRIDSTDYFLDATWAAGYCVEDEDSGILLEFVKRYNNYYWFTPFHDLARNHYPQNGKWVFEPNYTKEKYADNPYYASDVIPKIQLITPVSGIIRAKKGDTIHFKFEYKADIKFLQINSNAFRNPSLYQVKKQTRRSRIYELDTVAVKMQKYIDFKRNADLYEFDYIITDESLYYLELLFDYRRSLKFKVEVHK